MLQLIAHADRAFVRALNSVERELAGLRNPSPKKKSRKSLVEFDQTEQGYEECEDENNEIETEPTDKNKPPMFFFLRAARVATRREAAQEGQVRRTRLRLQPDQVLLGRACTP